MSESKRYDLEQYEAKPPGLFGSSDPAKIIGDASLIASRLVDVIQRKNLSVPISGRKYVRVEGWTLLGTLLGVFPVTTGTRELPDGYEATVEARTRSGEVVGAAVAICTRAESQWSKRDPYALLAMAQTRATSRALRQPLGFVMALAGYEATGAEEMPRTVEDVEEGFVGPDGENYAMEGSGVAALATSAQLKKLHATITELVKQGQDREALRDSIFATYEVTSTKQLTRAEASEAIENLSALVGAP